MNYFQNLYLPTTINQISILFFQLWVTFKICIFVIWNNGSELQYLIMVVVNYFQNLYLCDFQQRENEAINIDSCCELLSKFVSLWSPTTVVFWIICIFVLWITFKICIFVISNNTTQFAFVSSKVVSCFQIRNFVTPNNAVASRSPSPDVVNYFQNLYLCDFQQLYRAMPMLYACCELLSKFVSLWFPTTISL